MRRFLQGLGLGLLVAAVLMGVGLRSNGSSSDDNIIERARELGMVFPKDAGKDEASGPETSTVPTAEAPAATATGSSGKGAGVGGDGGSDTSQTSESPEPSPAETKAPEKTDKPKESEKPKDTEKPKETDKPEPTGSSDPNATPSAHKILEKGTEVKFKVRSGLLSSSVARELYEAGIIDDMWEFDHYIVRHNLGDKIIAGKYTLKVGDSYAKIAKAITHT
ncbi:MAG: hypothetical protein VZQ83_04715 [Eubacterium sp.]|nr:hypothetical protein [Eubacterium sp.]